VRSTSAPPPTFTHEPLGTTIRPGEPREPQPGRLVEAERHVQTLDRAPRAPLTRLSRRAHQDEPAAVSSAAKDVAEVRAAQDLRLGEAVDAALLADEPDERLLT